MSALTQDPHRLDTWMIPNGWNGQLVHNPQVICNVHLLAECLGRPCLVHNPSNHHMRDWPLLWDIQRRVFLRLCVHGVTHPDPDSWGDRAHPGGDDGCCAVRRPL